MIDILREFKFVYYYSDISTKKLAKNSEKIVFHKNLLIFHVINIYTRLMMTIVYFRINNFLDL